MVIPVYKKIRKHERNLCNDVTDIYECEGNQGVSELHNSDSNINALNNLCNQEPQGYPKVLSEGYTVTQVTASKSKEYWLDKFNERAAIYQYEANLSKVEAEVKAIDEQVIEWMSMHQSTDWERAIKKLLDYGISTPYYSIKK